MGHGWFLANKRGEMSYFKKKPKFVKEAGISSSPDDEDDSDLDLSQFEGHSVGFSTEKENKLSKQWTAIEKYLYKEDELQIDNSSLVYECKLWRDAFLYLRIRGRKIKIHGERKQDRIKNKIINLVVENLIKKLDDFQLIKTDFDEDKESRRSIMVSPKITVAERVISLVPSDSSDDEPLSFLSLPQKKGILKCSPGLIPPKRSPIKGVNFVDVELKKRNTLPLISQSKFSNSKWLMHSERTTRKILRPTYVKLPYIESANRRGPKNNKKTL